MSKNNHKEAIGLLLSGKSMKPVLIKIAQRNPAAFIKAFNSCYGGTEKPILSTNDSCVLAAARKSKIEAIKMHRGIYKSELKAAKEAVEKLMADNVV